MTRRTRPEDAIQRAVIEHLRIRGSKGVVFWHTPNGAFYGGKRNRKGISIQGAVMRGLGMRAGVSDVLLLHRARLYALEIKPEGGRATEAQLAFIADVQAAGGFGCVAEGIDRALAVLEGWGLLRGRAQ
jgi:hypothetical protein